MSVKVLSPGMLTTVQDAGRIGYASLGYRRGGACDKYSMRLGNLLVGNGLAGLTAKGRACSESRGEEAVLEFTMKGGALLFEEDSLIALTGADMRPEIDGEPAVMYEPLLIEKGSVLRLGTAVKGLRTYLAVNGGIDVPKVLGSRSTDLKCGLGGLEGRSLMAGDMVPLGRISGGQLTGRISSSGQLWRKGRGQSHSMISPEELWLKQPSTPWRIRGGERVPLLRVVKGPQEEYFSKEALNAFEQDVYSLSPQCDRMACRLEGPGVKTLEGTDIISDGIAEGAVQIASDGQPMILMADHQTTGGYAKIGTVISSDVAFLAQLRPRDRVKFRFVTPEEGIQAYRKELRKLRWLADRNCLGGSAQP